MNTKYFTDCKNPAELDTRYQKICTVFDLENIPDDQIFKQEVKKEYEALSVTFRNTQSENSDNGSDLSIDEVTSRIQSMNLDCELCGSWLWLTTSKAHQHRSVLKKLGFRYSPNKRAWYWRKYEHRSSNENPLPIELIREKYGSEIVQAG